MHPIPFRDRAILTLMMQETEAVLSGSAAQNDAADRGGGGEDEQGDEAEDDEEEEAAWRNGDNYERLLQLGHVLGDVKKDRWRTRAAVSYS